MARSTWSIARLLLASVVLAQGAVGTVCATSPARSTSIIFVADAHGGKGCIVDGLNQIIPVSRMPLRVEQVYWSTLDIHADFQNQYNFAVKGNQLAGRVLAVLANCPDAKIYLVGYGAGSTVVLRAANCLPPHSVTRIILLAPTVSCGYDVRRALMTSSEGIDNYYSRQDQELELAMKCFGPTDIGKKSNTSAAGLYGFVPMVTCTSDAQLYARLRQHNKKCYTSSNVFGFDGSYCSPAFLRTEIIPLFQSALYYTPRPTTTYVPRPAPAPVPPPAPPAYPPPAQTPSPNVPPPPTNPGYPPPPTNPSYPQPPAVMQGGSGTQYIPVPTFPSQRPLPPITSVPG